MNGEMLSVQFGLFAAEDLTAADSSVIPKDGLLEIINCDENGKAMFTADIPIGAELYIKELSTDSHYILSDEKYPVVFEYAGQDTAFVEIKANNGEPIKNGLIYGTVKGLKIDRETQKPIKGVLFGLFRADETEFTAEKAILTAQSDENGIFTFENVPYGDFIIRELKPADGFIANDEKYDISVTENEQIVEITVENDRIPEIIPPVPEIPNTGEQSNSGFFIGLGAIAIGGFASAGVIYAKRKDEKGIYLRSSRR